MEEGWVVVWPRRRRKGARVGAGAQRQPSPHHTAHTTIPDPSSIEEEGETDLLPKNPVNVDST